MKEGDTAPPALTVRVCDTLSCQMAGGDALLQELKRAYGPEVRVIPAPCIGRCQHAPAAVVGHNPVDHATLESVKSAVSAQQTEAQLPQYIDYAEYSKVAIFERAGLAFVDVDGQEPGRRFGTHDAPFATRGESRTTQTAQPRMLHGGNDVLDRGDLHPFAR